MLAGCCPIAAPRFASMRRALQQKAGAAVSQGVGRAKRNLQESQKEVSRNITPRGQGEMSRRCGCVGRDVRHSARIAGCGFAVSCALPEEEPLNHPSDKPGWGHMISYLHSVRLAITLQK